MAHQTTCDQCGRVKAPEEPWWELRRWAVLSEEGILSVDLCSDDCLATWSAARNDAGGG